VGNILLGLVSASESSGGGGSSLVESDFARGVAASLVAATVIYMFTRFVLPRIVGVIRKGPDLNGSWMTYDEPGLSAESHGTAEVKQLGTRLTVSVKRTTKRDGTSMQKPREFVYRGTFNSGNVVATFGDKSSKHETGTVVLHHSAADGRLEGKTMYHDDGQVVTHGFFMRKTV